MPGLNPPVVPSARMISCRTGFAKGDELFSNFSLSPFAKGTNVYQNLYLSSFFKVGLSLSSPGGFNFSIKTIYYMIELIYASR